MELIGKVVSLRELEESDAQVIATLANDPLLSQYTLTIKHPYSIEDAKGYIKYAYEKLETGKGYEFAITFNGILVGVLGLSLKENNVASVGYWIGKPYWKNGHATDAVLTILKFCFEHLELNEVEAATFEENIPSQKLLEKCGFNKISFKENVYEKNGRSFNEILFRIKKEEYKK